MVPRTQDSAERPSLQAKVSIVLCTRDRANDLLATLNSLSAVRIPSSWSVELLIVDNGSRDETPEIAKAFSWNGVQVRYLVQPLAGQARARNCALKEASGRIIVFTDDDVRFPSDWLECLAAPILSGVADAVVGRIVIPDHLQRPWLGPRLRTKFCSTELFRDPPDQLVGANMAFSRDVLKRVPAFDENLGPGALGFCDDTLFAKRLIAEGVRLRYVPTAAVEHYFASERLSSRALLRFFERHGESWAYVAYHQELVRHDWPLLYQIWWMGKYLMYRYLRGSSFLRGREPSDEEEVMVHGGSVWAVHYYRHFRRLQTQPRRYTRQRSNDPA